MIALILPYLIILCLALDRALSSRDFKSAVKTFLRSSGQLLLIFLPCAIGDVVITYRLLGSWWDLVIGIGLMAVTVILVSIAERNRWLRRRLTH